MYVKFGVRKGLAVRVLSIPGDLAEGVGYLNLTVERDGTERVYGRADRCPAAISPPDDPDTRYWIAEMRPGESVFTLASEWPVWMDADDGVAGESYISNPGHCSPNHNAVCRVEAHPRPRPDA